ncbi:MAG: ArsR family transcriptional regulator [Desulfuromonas sp.]|nr:MAG: ArsR family transcriptional regulator [Desulfuromonas sp.]
MLNVIKALADPTRLRLIGILEHGEFTVQDLVAILEMGQSRVSRHLRILVEAGICTVEKQGTWSYFKIDGKADFFAAIKAELIPRLSGIDGYHRDQIGLSRVLDERRRKSRQFFDQHARQWDRMVSELIPVEHYADHILRELDPGHLVVDVGVGTGRLLNDLSNSARYVVGIDQSSAMLDEARARVNAGQLDNVELRLGELTHLPVADGYADCVILNMVLHHAANPQDSLNELCRVLKPGGKLIVADLIRHDMEWFQVQMADQWMGFERREMDRWLDAAGFRAGPYVQIKIDDSKPSVFVLTAEKIEI